MPLADGALPTLPAANPTAPPPLAESTESAPSPTDINALRSAQIRVNKQQRKNRMFGRTLLAFVVVGAVIASALVFGRSYLFPTGWDATLTPIVDAIQEATGTEFDQTVALEAQSANEYAGNLLEFTLGSDWVANVPQWRALGLVEGDVSPDAVAAALAGRTAALTTPSRTRSSSRQIEPTQNFDRRSSWRCWRQCSISSDRRSTASSRPAGSA